MSDRHATLRILDANYNRAAEGLRAIEEYARFILGDLFLTRQCKELRHDLAQAVGTIPREELLAARDTLGDVGTEIAAADEYVRVSPRQVCEANQRRVEQSLRCLEEYSKIAFPAVARTVEQLRYRCYAFAKAVTATENGRSRLATARLYVLVDGHTGPDEFSRRVSVLVSAGVHILQLRDKRLRDRELLARARQLRAATQGTSTLFILNDRPDLAVLAHADGVHLGQEELSVAQARTIVGSGMLVGVSTHSLAQARQAVSDGADYLGCGPTFPSTTKSFAEFPGLEFLRQVAADITLPAFAIGGIHLQNLSAVLATGIRRVAVRGALDDSDDVAAEVRKLLDLLAHG